tara:strand:+ start:642 stop:938 length:297 start_codon:yes stop_codon:yes gene_type:complete
MKTEQMESRQNDIVERLTNGDTDNEDMLEEFYDISVKLNNLTKLTNDNTRDISIKCIIKLVEEGYVKDCIDTDDDTEFKIQDIIHEELNKALNIKESK